LKESGKKSWADLAEEENPDDCFLHAAAGVLAAAGSAILQETNIVSHTISKACIATGGRFAPIAASSICPIVGKTTQQLARGYWSRYVKNYVSKKPMKAIEI